MGFECFEDHRFGDNEQHWTHYKPMKYQHLGDKLENLQQVENTNTPPLLLPPPRPDPSPFLS